MGIKQILWGIAALVALSTVAVSQTSYGPGPTLNLTRANIWSALQTFNLGIAGKGPWTLNNNTAALPASLGTNVLQIGGADSVGAGAEAVSFGAGGSFTLRRAQGTGAIPTAVTAGLGLGSWNYSAFDGTAWASGGAYQILTTENWGVGAHGTYARVLVIPTGATAGVQAWEARHNSLFVAPTVPIPAGGTTGAGITYSITPNFGIFFGSGVPTLSAAKGSLYLRSDGSGTSDRAYINTDGGTTWTNLVTAL